MKPLIYHNPNCGTSRNALAALKEAGLEPEVIEYMKVGWTAEGLKALFARMGVTAREALRAKEAKVAELGLKDAAESDLIAAMVAHPVLVERPIVVTDKGARLCRPWDLVRDLI
jgi:arsenate reductase (glutaredoxin)